MTVFSTSNLRQSRSDRTSVFANWPAKSKQCGGLGTSKLTTVRQSSVLAYPMPAARSDHCSRPRLIFRLGIRRNDGHSDDGIWEPLAHASSLTHVGQSLGVCVCLHVCVCVCFCARVCVSMFVCVCPCLSLSRWKYLKDSRFARLPRALLERWGPPAEGSARLNHLRQRQRSRGADRMH